MATFADLTAKLNLNIANFAGNMQKASSMASKFAANMEGQINTGMTAPAKEAKFEFKDVARIVQGIIISKAFYSGLNAIRSATSAVWDFAQELEYAQMVYTNLFSSSELASNFINVLKDFAAVTPFTFQQSEAAAKRLLAYGIQYKNVMYVMRGVMAAATVQGNDAIIEPISRAFGQIYTKGRLMNEEMRQLAEAGIPAYEILQEKLGLTQKQLQNLGKQSIPASDAINALVDGINERFGNVLDQANTTMKGIISNIKDNALMIMSDVLDPMFEGIRGKLKGVGEWFKAVRDIAETKGAGGVFEALIPKELQNDLRQLIGSFIYFWNVLKMLGKSAGQILAPLGVGILQLLNIILPVINTVIGAVASLISVVTSNAGLMKVLTTLIMAAAAAWLVYRAYSLASAVSTAVIWGMINAVKGLITAFNFLLAHPIWALLMLGAGILVSVAGLSSKVGNSVKGITNSLTGMGGIDTSKILLPDSKERASDLGKFNNALDGTSGSMDNLANSTGKAAKAAKSLLGFDEVFKLNNPDEGNAGPDLGDLGLGGGMDLPELDPSSMLPDFSTFADNFKDKLLAALGGKKALISMGIGGLLGTIIGMIIGGPAGAKIGMALGLLAGWLWSKLIEKLGMTNAQAISLPIGTIIGAAIGLCVAGPAGAAIGAAIGALVGWIVSLFVDNWDKIKENLKNSIGSAIGMLIGGIVGTLIAGPVGTALGALVGYIIGYLIQLLVKNWGTVTDWFKEQWDAWLGRMKGHWASSIIGVIGLVVGTIIGGPLVGILGALAGFLIGTLVDLIINNWDKIKAWFVQAGKDIETFCKEVILVVSWEWELLKTSVANWLSTAWTNVKAWFSKAYTDIKAWFDNLPGSVKTWLAAVWTSISTWLSTVKTNVSTWLSTAKTNIDTWFTNLKTSISTWGKNLITSIGTFFTNLWNGIWKNITDIGTKIGNWWDNLWKNKSATVTVNGKTATAAVPKVHHATGGVFNREHVARFAEGNKAEAIIPLENAGAMQPFVDAVSDGLTATLLPIVAKLSGNGNGSLQPLYVGTLIADDRGLKELNRKMQVIQLEEDARRGTN